MAAGFYFDLKIHTTGCAWVAWSLGICLLGGRSLEMTALLIKMNDTTLNERRIPKEVTSGGSLWTDWRRISERTRK